MRIRRRPLTATEWGTIGRHCREANGGLHRITHALLITLPVATSDRWARLRGHFDHMSMNLGDQATGLGYPHFWSNGIGPGDGPEGWSLDWPKPMHGRRALTRPEWTALGQDVKATRGAFMSVGLALQHAYPQTIARPWLRLADRIDSLKARLEGEAIRQHPGWLHCSRVFYGPHSPEDQPAA